MAELKLPADLSGANIELYESGEIPCVRFSRSRKDYSAVNG